MRRVLECSAASLAVALSFQTFARAEVVLPKIPGDHLVLQRGMDAPVWGRASPRENISVRGDWQPQAAFTTAGADGKWLVKLPTPAPGGPHTIAIEGKNKIVLKDVLAGDFELGNGPAGRRALRLGRCGRILLRQFGRSAGVLVPHRCANPVNHESPLNNV